MHCGGDRIRVLQVITRLAARGAPRHVIDLSERLDRQRFEVDILTGTPDPDEGCLLEEARGRGVRVGVVEEMGRAVKPVQDVRALVQVRWKIRRGDYDVVHTHISKAGVLGRTAARAEGVPVVVHTYHGPVAELQKSRSLLAVERWAARKADVLIAVSESAMEHQLALGIGRRDQYRVIHNGIDLEYFQQRVNGSIRDQIGGGPVIGTVGSLTVEKGTEDLITSAGLLVERFPELRVCFVGDGSQRRLLMAHAKREGLSDHVMFAGNVADVRPWLTAFDVFVLPSRNEGMSRALLEAMACGCAVVATDVGAAAALVKEDEVLVAPGDVGGLSEAIGELLSEPEKRSRAGEMGREVAARFDVGLMSDEVGRVYEEVLAANRRPHG